MARGSVGWVSTTKNDSIQDFWTSNLLKNPIRQPKVQSLPPLNIHYDTPRKTNDKKWTDQSLLSTRSIDDYLAESDAFQRASFANIIEKWKQYDRHKTDRLISSFDTHYNMKIRFRHDEQLNRSSEVKYAPVATYYRFLGSEHNPKNTKPCIRHKRRTQEYEERHIRDILQLPTTVKSRSQPYFLPKITDSTPTETATETSSTARPSVSLAEQSHHTFA